MSTNNFGLWCIKLSARLHTLKNTFYQHSVRDIERELNVCQAETQHLIDYINQNSASVEMSQYGTIFVDIYTTFSELEFMLKKKKEPFWKKALGVVIRVVSILADIVGLGFLLPPGLRKMLPPGQ